MSNQKYKRWGMGAVTVLGLVIIVAIGIISDAISKKDQVVTEDDQIESSVISSVVDDAKKAEEENKSEDNSKENSEEKTEEKTEEKSETKEETKEEAKDETKSEEKAEDKTEKTDDKKSDKTSEDKTVAVAIDAKAFPSTGAEEVMPLLTIILMAISAGLLVVNLRWMKEDK